MSLCNNGSCFGYRFSREQSSGPLSAEAQKAETEFCDAICRGDNEHIRSYTTDTSKNVSFVTRWDFIQKCAKIVASTGNLSLLKDVLTVLLEVSVKPYEIGEAFAIEAIAAQRSELTVGLLKHWSIIRNEHVGPVRILSLSALLPSHTNNMLS